MTLDRPLETGLTGPPGAARCGPLRPRRLRLRDRTGVVLELLGWLKAKRAWWLAPVVLALIVLSLVAFIASGSAIAPFFYAIF